MKSFQIWILLLISIQIETVISFKCGTNYLKIKPKHLNIKRNNETSSILKDTGDQPIEIAYDFTTLKKPSSMSSSIFETVKSILKDTRNEFSKILQVQHTDIDLTGAAEDIMEGCLLSTIGEGYEDFLIDNDLIIFPMFDTLQSGVLAAAAPCLLHPETNRPVGGIVYINNNLDLGKTNTNFYMKNILLHEITHILVFHPIFFNYFNMITTYNGVSYIKSPKVLEKAKEHFGCSTIQRIALENDGGEGSAGSHWESRYMLGDYMISTDFPDAAMSDITLALFEDTGLYRVNYYSGGLFKFGKNKGCSFLNGACTNNGVAAFDDFCTTSGQPTCSSSRAIKTSCYTTEGGYPTADSCPVPYEYHTQSSYYPKHCRYGTSSDSLEKIGESSFCFMSSLSQGSTASSEKPVCYEVSCDTTNKKIIVTVGSATIICDDETVSNPSGLQGNIICPKYSDLCASSTSSGKVYNDMYNIFTKKAADDRYTYPTTFNDFTGDAYDDDDVFWGFWRNDNYYTKINLILLAFGLRLSII